MHIHAYPANPSTKTLRNTKQGHKVLHKNDPTVKLPIAIEDAGQKY